MNEDEGESQARVNPENIFEASQLCSSGYFFQQNRNVAPQEGEVKENIDGDEEEEEQTPKQQMQTAAGFSKELFLEAVRHFKCLWDTSERSYKERNTKANAWKQLAITFTTDSK